MTNKLLITGCARSGTSLLASLLGAHSQINMLSESYGKDINRLAGKKYAGNKLCMWSQLRWTRASRWGHLMNRVANFGSGVLNNRVAPVSALSLRDYIDMKAKIIIIVRERDKSIKSAVVRAGLSERKATIQYDKAGVMCAELIHQYDNCLSVRLEDLLEDPAYELDRICQFLEIDYEPGMTRGVKYNLYYPEYQTI
jgi:hypothetical protein